MIKMDLIFDLDGTLIDISERHYRVYHSLVSRLGGIPLSKPVYWRMKRNKTPTSIMISSSLLPKESLYEYMEKFIKKIEEPKLLDLDKIFSYTIPTLDLLSKTSQLYLTTARQFADRTKKQLTKLNLITRFKDIKIYRSVSTETRSKVVMIKQLFLSSNIMVIGDTEDDILSAQELSITSVAVTSGLRNKSRLGYYNPTYLIKNISELPKIINNLN